MNEKKGEKLVKSNIGFEIYSMKTCLAPLAGK